jgi:hypothetical protein
MHLWQYLAEFFLEQEIFQTKVVEKIETTFYIQYNLSEKREAFENM